MDDFAWSRLHCPIPDPTTAPAAAIEFEAAAAGVPQSRRNHAPHPQWNPDQFLDGLEPEPTDDSLDAHAAALHWAIDHVWGDRPPVTTACRRWAALCVVLFGGEIGRTPAELAAGCGCSRRTLAREVATLRQVLGVK